MTIYNDISFTLDLNEMHLDVGLSDSGGGKLPTYEGEYIVTPKPFLEQTLATKNKSLVDDVTVLEIPYSEVSNPSGGITANIGYEL